MATTTLETTTTLESTLESFPRPSLTDEVTPLLPQKAPLPPPPTSSFSRNFMLVTITTTTLYFTSFISTFYVSDSTLLIIAYTIQGCATMWCMIVWFLHHVWLVEKPVKFMEPLHFSPHYYEILRFTSLLERYEDVRNIAVAGFSAALLLAFATGNVFVMLVRWYWGMARLEIYGWFGEYEVATDGRADALWRLMASCVGWVVVLTWLVVTCKVVYSLVLQMRDICRMVKKRRDDHLFFGVVSDHA